MVSLTMIKLPAVEYSHNRRASVQIDSRENARTLYVVQSPPLSLGSESSNNSTLDLDVFHFVGIDLKSSFLL
jgi:hypothetical protein